MGTEGFWPAIKWLGREPYHLPPRSVKVKRKWSHTYNPTHTRLQGVYTQRSLPLVMPPNSLLTNL